MKIFKRAILIVHGFAGGVYDYGETAADTLTYTITSYVADAYNNQIKAPSVSVTPDEEYNLSIKMSTTNGVGTVILKVVDGASDYELTRKSLPANQDTTFSANYTAKTSSIRILLIAGYSNTGTYKVWSPTVTPAGETSSQTTTTRNIGPTVAPGSWIDVTRVPSGNWGGAFEYQLGTNSDLAEDGLWYLKSAQNQWGSYTARYKNADSIDGFVFDSQAYNNAGGATIYTTDLKTAKGLQANTKYKMTVNVSYAGIGNDGQGSQHNYVQTTGGVTNMDISRTVTHNTQETYTADIETGTGDFSFKLVWKNDTTDVAEKGEITITSITFTAAETTSVTTSAAPTTTAEPGYSAATLGAWTFADAPGTSGWQYFVHANSTGSTYKGGTGMNDPLFIKYGTYVPDADYSCMARSPITTVTSGNSCTGTISITSSANIGAAGDKVVGAAVYAYNSSTGEYTWLASASEEDTNVVADTKTTFHINYTAPETGKIVYILTTSYTPVATLKFEATHSEQTAAPTTTTAAPTTTADDWIDVPDATETTVGAWTLFANYAEWAQLQYRNSVTTPSTMADTSIRVKNPTGWYNWNETAKLSNFLAGKMTAGQSYKITINVNSSKATAAGSTIKVALDNVIYYFELDAGNNALTIDGFTYVGDSNDVTFDLSLLQAGTELTFSSITFEGSTDPSTTEETTQAPQPVVDPDIDLTGYQINTSSEGFRMVGQVEPTINGQPVTEFGFVYGLSKIYKPSTDSYQDTGITNDDMEVGVDNKYVVSYATTSDGIIENKMAHSTTATYFARTMTFGKKNKAAFASKYKVRVYAKLANNQYVYSDVNDFAVFDIAEALYQGCLMNNLANHEYLYNTILTKVNENYEEVPYEYSHKIAEPGEVNS